MILFTLVFYAIFARFREQACTFICPYGRFQSTLLDENTIVVAYDYKRGEKRGPLHRGQTVEQRQARGIGDCIDCRQCVASARPASTSATARRWNASTAPRASMPATTSWTRSGVRAA